MTAACVADIVRNPGRRRRSAVTFSRELEALHNRRLVLDRDLFKASGPHVALRVAVNIPGKQFSDERLQAAIEEALELANLGPDALEVEITETTIAQDPTGIERGCAMLQGYLFARPQSADVVANFVTQNRRGLRRRRA